MVAVSSVDQVKANYALLPLKFTPPPVRPGVLLRQDLQSLLADVRLNPVTLLTAPAGYGKTTLLSQWTQELSRTGAPVCWLSLDAADRDPALFLAYIISAFQSQFPTIGADAWRVLHSAANLDRDWPLVAGALSSDLQRRLLSAAFLILDDIHLVVESAVIAQILGYLLRTAPPTLHVVLSSRREPVFAPLGRLRTEGRVLEVTHRHLHLTTHEVQQILAAQSVVLSQDAMQLLLERTEGWALSVQLAARALAAQPVEQREAFVQALGGSQEQLLAYLSSEVLADLPRDIMDFLRLAAIPSSFDADLLAEVLQSEDVEYLLQRTRVLGLPILPMDEQGIRLRFHPLWRELLLRQSASGIDELELRVLQRRFGQVFEARGDLEAALEHYAAARDTADLIRALRERAWPLLNSPRRDMVRRWLEQIPAELRDSEPDLLHIWGLSLASVDSEQAENILRRAVDTYHDLGMYEREMRALGDLTVLWFWRGRGGNIDFFGRRAAFLAHYLSDDWSIGAGRVCVVGMLYAQGRELGALRVAHQAESYPLSPAWRWMLAMLVSSLTVRLGRPAEAIRTLDTALALSAIDLDDRLRQNLLRMKAMALFQQGFTNDAIMISRDAHQHLSQYEHNSLLVFSSAQLAQLLALNGNTDEALTYLTQARTGFSSLGNTSVLTHLQVTELFVRRDQHLDEGELLGLMHRLQSAPDNAPDLRIWLLLAVVMGERGFEARALSFAQEIARAMEPRDFRLFLACAWLYVAYLAEREHQPELQQRALRAGWDVVVADNFHYLPILPAHVVSAVCEAALLAEMDWQPVAQVLRRQIPEQSVALLQKLLAEPQPRVREGVVHALGYVGATSAYVALRGLLKDRDTGVRRAAQEALEHMVYRPQYTLRVRTLGSFALWRGDQEVRDRDWRSSKARQLFQIMITERERTLPRDWLLERLWPEMDTEAAANNMRVTLNRMSKAIEPERPDGAPSSYILQQAETYSFNLESDYELDATQFVNAVKEGREAEKNGHHQVAVAAYRRAVALYGGPYLPDAMYEDWTVVERERLALLFNEAAIHLGKLLLNEGAAHEAIGLAWRVLENDQAHEEAYQLLMRAHMYLGERSTALRLYNRCVSALQQEFGLEPLPETTALFQAIREAGEIRVQKALG